MHMYMHTHNLLHWEDVSSEDSSSSEELADEDSPSSGSGTFSEEHLGEEETDPPFSDSEKSYIESHRSYGRDQGRGRGRGQGRGQGRGRGRGRGRG